MSQLVPEVEILTARKLEAAALLADDRLSDSEIAESVGIDRRTLNRWKHEEPFVVEVRRLIAEYERLLIQRGIARRSERIHALNDRWMRMRKIIEARAQDPELRQAAGGDTGLIVRQLRGIGKGDDFQIVEVFEVDTGLLRELREHEKQAAQELGQWVDKVAPTDPTGNHEYGELSADERRARLAAIFDSARTRGSGQIAAGAGEVGTPPGSADGGGDHGGV